MAGFKFGFLGFPRPSLGPLGEWVPLDAQIAANSPTIRFTRLGGAAYDQHLLVGVNIVPVTNAAQLYLNMSVNGGATYEAGGTDYTQALPVHGANATDYDGDSGSFSSNVLTGTTNGISNTPNQGGLNFELNLLNLAVVGVTKHGILLGAYAGSVTLAAMNGAIAGISSTLVNNAVSALQLSMNTGNILSGRFYLLGHRSL